MSDSYDRINALQSLLSYDTVSSEVADALSNVIGKEKEKQVLKLHKYKISGPFVTKKQTIYSTRCPWLPNKKVNRSSYKDIIDYLYDHYFGQSNDKATVREIYEQMIKEYEARHLVSSLTLSHYKADWRKYVEKKEAEWLDKPIKNVKASQISNYYREITADETILQSTFNNLRSVINAVFKYAFDNDIPCIDASRVSTLNLKFARVTDKWKDVYSPDDKAKILATCSSNRATVYTKAIELMFCLDIRIGELRALKKDDADLEKRTISVSHQMVDVKTDSANRHPVRSEIMKGKKEAGRRTEPLSERAMEIIKWLFDEFPDSEWLLPNRSGKEPIYTNCFNQNLKKICNKAGVKYFSSHGIRFHIISAMYDAGIIEKEIQRLSGHTTANMTRHYNRHISDTCEDAKVREVLG